MVFVMPFGPTGLFAQWIGDNDFIWAVSMGLIVMVIAYTFRKLQANKLDSTINDADLLMEKGKVLVTIDPGKIGKVRIYFGGMNIDRYAKGKNETDEFNVGDDIQVHEVRNDIVIIEHAI